MICTQASRVRSGPIRALHVGRTDVVIALEVLQRRKPSQSRDDNLLQPCPQNVPLRHAHI